MIVLDEDGVAKLKRLRQGMIVSIDETWDELTSEMGAGRLARHVPMAPFTTFRIGGLADLLFVARSSDELIGAVYLARQRELPYLVLGTGANILVGDGGFRGLVIKNEASGIAWLPDGSLRVESGAVVGDLIRLAVDRGLSGLEHFAGIPSSVGGALWQNLHFLSPDRSRTVYIAECLAGACVLDESGQVTDVDVDYFQFGYDESVLHHGRDIALSATFRLQSSDPDELRRVVAANLRWRREHHPDLGAFPSAGSIFKKIEGLGAGRLIDQCGLKGRILGGAQVSPRHANFIVNLGGARARDVLDLVELCRESVWARFNVELQMEVGVVGAL